MPELESSKKNVAKSKFKQQTLSAWKPLLTPTTVLPTFFFVGLIFIIVGAVLLSQVDDIVEYEFDYTNCVRTNHDGTSYGTGETCSNLLQADSNFTSSSALWNRCECAYVEVPLSGLAGKDVYIYYAFENYYQNHRRYVKSRSDAQLRSAQSQGNEECNPLESSNGLYYAPCGLIANSLFNDTIELLTGLSSSSSSSPQTGTPRAGPGTLVSGWTGTDISWQSDRDVKFRNPCDGCELCSASGLNQSGSISPPNWPVASCELGRNLGDVDDLCVTDSDENSGCWYNPWSEYFMSSGLGYQNEDFIVWMRTAALPTFKKLYRRIPGGVPDGVYSIRIGYNYPVQSFGGVKKIYISTTSAIGGKSWFLPWCYLIVGILSFLAAFTFLIMQQCFSIKRPIGQQPQFDNGKFNW